MAKPEKNGGLRLLDDRIAVVRDAAPEKSKGGIVIPDAVQEKLAQGVVKVTGAGRRLDTPVSKADRLRFPDGVERRPMEVKVGDRIVFNTFAGFPVKTGGVDYLILNEADVLAILLE